MNKRAKKVLAAITLALSLQCGIIRTLPKPPEARREEITLVMEHPMDKK